MTTIYVFRHAQANGNREKRFQGSIEQPLSELGLQQLEYLADYCGTLPLEKVYTSPLGRAKQTAQAIARTRTLPVEVLDELREIDGGLWENCTWDEIEAKWPEEYQNWMHGACSYQAPGGECMRHVYERAAASLRRIEAENPGGTVAIASHGCVVRNILAFCMGGLEQFEALSWQNNTGLSILTMENGKPHLVTNNENGWLPEAFKTV